MSVEPEMIDANGLAAVGALDGARKEAAPGCRNVASDTACRGIDAGHIATCRGRFGRRGPESRRATNDRCDLARLRELDRSDEVVAGQGRMSRTLGQRTNGDGFPKAGEFIEMTGLEGLDAPQRAISNLLYQHAHDTGQIAEPGAVFEIPMATLRAALSKHESGDRLRASLTGLMRIVVRVAYLDESGGNTEQRVMISGLFRFLDVSAKDLNAQATLRYGVAQELRTVCG